MSDDSQVVPRKRQYIIGRVREELTAEGGLHAVRQVLDKDPEIDLVKVIPPRGLASALAAGETHPDSILVARMSEEHAVLLSQQARNQILVEPDRYLSYVAAPPSVREITIRDSSSILLPNDLAFSVTVAVKDPNGTPVNGARVFLYGSLSPVQGITDGNGEVRLTLFGETGRELQELHIEPKANYWSLWIPRPALDPNITNVVTVRPLNETFAQFPQQQYIGWGQRAMGLDRVPASYTGKGARVAVIDSGVATSHEDLNGQVRAGYDFVNGNDTSWNEDIEFHGTHCTGVIVAKDNGHGIRGFAPEAEVHSLKILPGGRFSDLIDALEHCIEQQVDVVNVSLGSEARSQLVEQVLQRAREQGVACIAAVGNSNGPVQYPASSPNVFGVAAIGKQDTFPQDSYHSAQILTNAENPPTAEGYFSARFSCFGPEVDVCAPGVAVLSTVPPNDYAVWDGTSMAAPHVVGLAALVIAHHADFQTGGRYAQRNSRRVERLFEVIKKSAQPVRLPTNRIGAGLPNAPVAMGLVAPSPMADVLQHLFEDLNTFLQEARKQMGGGVQGEQEDVEQAMQQLTALVRQAQLHPDAIPPRHEGFAASTNGVEQVNTEWQKLMDMMRKAGLLL
jgi:hypothetical protein